MIDPDKKYPLFALRLLQWFCPLNLYEGIEGDLMEQFDDDVRNLGASRAKRRFIRNTIRFIQPGILLRNRISIPMLHQVYSLMALIRSYMIIAWRNMLRYKTISLINIIGLSVSMSMGLLILMLIKNQFDYDTFHPYRDRLYRITTMVTDRSGDRSHFASTPFPLKDYLNENFSWIEEAVTLNLPFYKNARRGNEELFLDGTFADVSFFNVFGFKLKTGNPNSALAEPFSMVLTEEVAVKFFGKKDPMGEMISLEGFGDFKVTGIMDDPDKPSHIKYGSYTSSSTLQLLANAHVISAPDNDWKNYLSTHTYLRLKSGTVEQILINSLKISSAQTSKIMAPEGGELKYEFFAQPIDKIRFSELQMELGSGRSLKSLIILASLGGIIILLAVFNYTNVTVASTLNRAKEIGVRKVAGASRSQLFLQLILEAIVVCIFALIISAVITPYIPVNIAFRDDLPETIDFTLIVWIIIFAVMVGCLAGFFPALVLSRIRPIHALKNLITTAGKTSAWKNALIVVQFSMGLVFLIILLAFYQQMKFQINSDYGFTRKNILEIELKNLNHHILKSAIESLSGVEQVSASSNPIFTWGQSCRASVQNHSINLEYYSVDNKFISTYDLKILTGSNFFPDLSDRNEQEIILNEKAVEVLRLGNSHEAIGKSIIIDDTLNLRIAGIVKNFHAHPFKHGIYPLAFRHRPNEFNVLIVKVGSSALQHVRTKIKAAWSKLEPDVPLACSIFEDEFNERQSHQDDLSMLGSLAVIAMIISYLGLLGVVMFSTQSRMKEIGVRKVMGARAFQIINLLSWKFVRLLLLSGFLAMPIGYWISNTALKSFAYKIQLGLGTLLAGFLLMILLGLITICSQTIEAALRNPVDTLKYE